jgi:hypothetical protein
MDILFEIDELDENYLIQLREKIPVLQNNLLLQLVLNYAIELCQFKQNISSTLHKINQTLVVLSQLETIPSNLNMNQVETENNSNFKTYTYENNINNRIYVKILPLNAQSLIEAIVQFTLHFYSPNSCPEIVSMLIQKNDRMQFQLKMQNYNSSKYTSLQDYLLFIMNNENISDDDKIENYKNIFIQVANKINELQQIGFIHGDFHSNNIYVDSVNRNIHIIDCGFSCIPLPLKNDSLTAFLLCVPVKEYLSDQNTRFRVPNSSFEELTKIDLFNLMEDLFSYLNNPNENYEKNFIKMMKYIRSLYVKPELNELSAKGRHFFVCSDGLLRITDDFKPQLFIQFITGLESNNIKNYKSSRKKKVENNTQETPTHIPMHLGFGNNNN